MPTRWRPSTLLLLAAFAACGRAPLGYRPAGAHRAALGGARFEVVRLAQLFPGPHRYQVTLHTTVSGATTLEDVHLGPAWVPACIGGVAAKEVRVGGRVVQLPLDLSGDQEIEIEVRGPDEDLGFTGDSMLDLSLSGGCARVPLSGHAPDLAWRPEARRWLLGLGQRMVLDLRGGAAHTLVARWGRWLGPASISLEVGAGYSMWGSRSGFGFVAGPFGVVGNIVLWHRGSTALGIELGYEITRADVPLVHGPRGAFFVGFFHCDAPGIPRGPQHGIHMFSVPVIAAHRTGAAGSTLTFGYSNVGVRGF